MTYAAAVLADSPVRYFPCQETAGTTLADSSGNAGNGSIVNGAVVNDTALGAAPSQLGKHIRLDGSNDYLDLGSSNWFAPATSGFTWEGWFYHQSVQSYARYFDFNSTTGTLDMLLARNNLDTQHRFDTGGSFASFTCASQLGAWHHLVITCTAGGSAKFYVDGTLVNTISVGAPTNTNRVNKWVGRSTSSGGDPYFQGGVTQVAVYHSVLSGARVAAHYTAGTTVPDPPDDPTGLAITPGTFGATFTWSAVTGATGYEVRLEGGAGTDVGNVLTHDYTGLTPETLYDSPGAEVRAYNADGFSGWVAISFTTLPTSPPGIVLYVGVVATDVFPGCTAASVRRGLTPDGATEKLEPGVATVILKGEEYNPLDNEDLRPGQPLQLALHVETEDGPADLPVFTGTIKRAAVTVHKETGTIFTTVTALDAVPVLAATPYIVAHKGNLTQRLTPVLDAAAVDYVITDSAPALVAGSLPTDKRTVLEQLLLVRDTMHAIAYVDSANVLQVIADQDRDESTPDVVLTDSDYVGLDLGFDTDDLVDVMTIELLTDTSPVVESFDLPTLVAEWGERAQTVTVNDGAPENHALRFMARLPGPALVAKTIRVNGTLEGFLAVAELEIAQPVQVIQGDLLDVEQQIVHLVHTITPRPYREPKWMTDVTVRQREVRPLRWDDVPGTIEWDDLDPAMTWNTAVFWHP